MSDRFVPVSTNWNELPEGKTPMEHFLDTGVLVLPRQMLSAYNALLDAERRKKRREAKCVCLVDTCDCQSPNSNPGLISNECPVHNENPYPSADCPIHG